MTINNLIEERICCVRRKMRLTIFDEEDKVLLVGEGNFSFGAALAKHDLKITLTATCYEFAVAFDAGKKNIEYLKRNGVRVLLGVDARKLSEHPMLETELFDKIIFNFPHVGGKMRIDKNRELLKEFFMSAEKLLGATGQVLVTLCNGQGGTPSDNPVRRWDDSWKIVEMAAHGNFLLTTVEPFRTELFDTYTNVGYRSLEKGFNVQNALVHIFQKADPPNSANIAPTDKLENKKIFQGIEWRELVSLVGKNNVFKFDTSSIYPLVFTFDITFSICSAFNETQFYVTLHNFAGNIIDNVEFVRFYEFPDSDKITKTYRISYRSFNVPLYRKRIVELHRDLIKNILEANLNVVVTK